MRGGVTGLRDDEAADAAVLLMTAATDDVRSVTELSQLCRTLQQKCEILQVGTPSLHSA